jgi:Flp pilus assembly protein TadG
MRCSKIRCRHRLRSQAGVAAIEFAVIAPVLILLVGAAMDLGAAIENAVRLENAARTAAQYATRSASDLTGAQSAALATLAGWSNATVSVGPLVCQCPPAGAATGGAVVDCSTYLCATGMQIYITATATHPFTSVFPTSSLIPFNAFGTLTRTVVARVQ